MRDSRELTVSKLFYLFFFAAFGSLFPLLGVYFKQMGMNALQCGILMGIRPLIEYLSSPFWAGVAERYRKGKLILLCSLASWLLFTMSFSVVQPPAASCITFNLTHHLLYPPNTKEIDFAETEAVNIRPKRQQNHLEFLSTVGFHTSSTTSASTAITSSSMTTMFPLKQTAPSRRSAPNPSSVSRSGIVNNPSMVNQNQRHDKTLIPISGHLSDDKPDITNWKSDYLDVEDLMTSTKILTEDADLLRKV
ncbi:major facilitator superfamily domain-containing protein 6-like [Tropilaelaps mercedesae]|uniref:Major facilitator superfamily domain-containing protein 6-like n=1 Tax=Tropilaelaps mercedesae TaxID=418985 RepID=A0A1V9XRI7_9ACAR|nr:major facilitator superfamily domain-containing protein 6-like [Tropilaelaps mercedesae]